MDTHQIVPIRASTRKDHKNQIEILHIFSSYSRDTVPGMPLSLKRTSFLHSPLFFSHYVNKFMPKAKSYACMKKWRPLLHKDNWATVGKDTVKITGKVHEEMKRATKYLRMTQAYDYWFQHGKAGKIRIAVSVEVVTKSHTHCVLSIVYCD